jgi:Tol biopolymer transport system component
VEFGEEIRFFQASGKSIYGMALSPDGTKLVTAAGNWQQNTTGEVKVWDAATGTLIRELPGFERHAWTPVLSPDGRWLAVSGGQNTLRIYDTATWNEKSRLNVSIGVRALAFSPDGKTLASASETNNEPVLKLWDVDTGRERLSLSGLNELVFHLRFAPDGKTLLASCGDGRVLVWDVPPPKSAVARK